MQLPGAIAAVPELGRSARSRSHRGATERAEAARGPPTARVEEISERDLAEPARLQTHSFSERNTSYE